MKAIILMVVSMVILCGCSGPTGVGINNPEFTYGAVLEVTCGGTPYNGAWTSINDITFHADSAGVMQCFIKDEYDMPQLTVNIKIWLSGEVVWEGNVTFVNVTYMNLSLQPLEPFKIVIS